MFTKRSDKSKKNKIISRRCTMNDKLKIGHWLRYVISIKNDNGIAYIKMLNIGLETLFDLATFCVGPFNYEYLMC